MLIVCEGEKTEPNYFRAFPLATLDVRVVGAGANTRSVVEIAIQERDRARSTDPFDRVWAVFDRDSFPHDRMHAATTYAERLSTYLGRPYRKNARDLYDLLLPRQPTATRNARRLLAYHPSPLNPANANPATTVHTLVAELNHHLRR